MHDVVLAWLSGATGATSFATMARSAGLSWVVLPELLSGATSFAISARFAALIFSVVTVPVLATSSATMARSAGLSWVWVTSWAEELTWLVAVARPRKKDSAKSAMTVKT